MAQAERFRAQLDLLRAVEPIMDPLSLSALDDIVQQREEWARDYLESVATKTRERGVQVRMVVMQEDPHIAITRYAEMNKVDLIVLCSRGHSGQSCWAMGGVADRIVRGARVPVLLVQPIKKHH